MPTQFPSLTGPLKARYRVVHALRGLGFQPSRTSGRSSLLSAADMTALAIALVICSTVLLNAAPADSSIHFDLKTLPFRLENSGTQARNAPETMPGGVAIFDYNGDGRPDIFFTNGANIATLKKDDAKYRNRLFRNDGNGVFTDVTDAAGLAGSGYDMGVAAADYDNDGHPDLFVAGLHHSTLYHNNGDGTFTDVTGKSGFDASLNRPDPQYGPLWAITAVWVDVNDDGLLDLFVVNYMQWEYSDKALCAYEGVTDYCHPKFYKGQPNQLFPEQPERHISRCLKRVGRSRACREGNGCGNGRLRWRRPSRSVRHQ